MKNKGFTLIELLIVITLLGILAVAVLSAINPLEQINRSRDTSSQSDAEQMINALDRYYASKGYHAWQSGATDSTDFDTLVRITAEEPAVTDHADCSLVEILSSGDIDTDPDCVGSEELKPSYIQRITETDSDGNPKNNPLHIYYDSEVAGASVYVCFAPASGDFKKKATDRCAGETFPVDLEHDLICGVTLPNGTTGDFYCLP